MTITNPCPRSGPTRVTTAEFTPSAAALLATIPEFPAFTGGGFDRYAALLPHVLADHDPHADMGVVSGHVWCGGEERAFSRCGPVLLIRTDGDRELMVVTLGGITALAAEHYPRMIEVLKRYDLRYLTPRTAWILQPAAVLARRPLGRRMHDTDYVYDLRSIATMDGLSRHAKDIAHLEKHGDPIVRRGRLSEPWVRSHMTAVYDRWEASRPARLGRPAEVAQERLGLFSLPADERTDHLAVYCLEAYGREAGFSLVEHIGPNMLLGCILKYDRGVRGATAYLRRHVARIGEATLGEGTLNLAQSAGVGGLMRAKSSWRPCGSVAKWGTLPGAA